MDLEYQLRVEADEIIIGFPDGVQNCFKKLDFPQLFFEWQSEARIEMFSLMDQAGATAAKMMPVHLPTMGTISNDVFPINLITRGMGLLLKASILDQVTESFESARKRGTCQVPEKSLRDRLSAARVFYADPSNYDPTILGGLEIFEGRTSQNLAKNPLVALLFSGAAPKFPSYQFNGVIEVIDGDNPDYRFLLAARESFAHDAFHVHQVNYPFRYLFHLAEIRDKTPYSRK